MTGQDPRAQARQLVEKGAAESAVAVLRRHLMTYPEDFPARADLGAILWRRKAVDEALAVLTQALKVAPTSSDALWPVARMLMRAYEKGGQSRMPAKTRNAVIEYLEAIIVRNPSDGLAWANLGRLRRLAGRTRAAPVALDKAMRLVPPDARIMDQIARDFTALGLHGPAAGAYRRLMRANPHEPKFVNEYLQSLKGAGDTDLFVKECHARHKETGDSVAFYQAHFALPRIVASAEEMQGYRTRYEDNARRLKAQPVPVADPVAEIGSLTFLLAYHGRETRPVQEDMQQMFRAAHPALAWRAPHLESGFQGIGGKIRVGFVSQLFHNHTIGQLTGQLIRHLPRDRIELSLVRTGRANEAHGKALDAAADRVVQIPNDLPAAQRVLAGEKFDVLFYTDLGMRPLTQLLAHARLAPVQCVWWGHPDTTGHDGIDYFISSRWFEDAAAQDHYSETLIRMNAPSLVFDRPKVPMAEPKPADFGLPETAHIYVCLQAAFKFHPDYDLVLRQILERDPLGLLVVLEDKTVEWTNVLKRRWARTLGPCMERVVFKPRMPVGKFMQLQRLGHAVLDTFHFGGGLTSLQAFAAGGAVVSLPGSHLRARLTRGYYRRMGFTDLLVETPEAYVDTALRLARDREFNAYCRREILDRCGVLFDDMDCAREYADLFVAMAEAARRGETLKTWGADSEAAA